MSETMYRCCECNCEGTAEMFIHEGIKRCNACESPNPRTKAIPASEERRAATPTIDPARAEQKVREAMRGAASLLLEQSKPLTLDAIRAVVQEVVRDETPSLSEIGAELRRELDRRPPPMPTEQAYVAALVAYDIYDATHHDNNWNVDMSIHLQDIMQKARAAHLAAQAEKGRAV